MLVKRLGIKRAFVPCARETSGAVVAQAHVLDPSPPLSQFEGRGVAVEEAGDTYLTDLGELDEDDFRGTWPKIPAAEGAERGELREELRDLTKQKLGLAHKAWDPKIGKREAPLSRIDRDEVQAAPHRHAELMQRKEASCFRQFVRLLPRFSPRLSRGGVAQDS